MPEQTITPQEWRRLAWAIGAADLSTDEPTYPDTAHDEEAEAFRSWAETTHGATARDFIATHDALQTIRFGPETSPTPWDGPAGGWPDPPYDLEVEPDLTPDTAEQFARRIQAIVTEHDDDWEIRDEQIVALATKYAGQFLPGGLVFPIVGGARVTAAAVAGETFHDDRGYYVAVIEEGRPGFTYTDGGRYSTVSEAEQQAWNWNQRVGAQVQDIIRITKGVQAVMGCYPASLTPPALVGLYVAAR
jgi:hypothetical protein